MLNKTSIKVPKKYQEGIEEVFHDSDGYWVYAKEGYTLSNTDFNVQIVQCDTQAQVLLEIRHIKKMEEIEVNEVKQLEPFQAFSEMLKIIRDNGGTFHSGNSWHTIWFKVADVPNHVEVSDKVFAECKALGLNVYGMSHIKAWKDEHNDVKECSYFNYQ